MNRVGVLIVVLGVTLETTACCPECKGSEECKEIWVTTMPIGCALTITPDTMHQVVTYTTSCAQVPSFTRVSMCVPKTPEREK